MAAKTKQEMEALLRAGKVIDVAMSYEDMMQVRDELSDIVGWRSPGHAVLVVVDGKEPGDEQQVVVLHLKSTSLEAIARSVANGRLEATS